MTGGYVLVDLGGPREMGPDWPSVGDAWRAAEGCGNVAVARITAGGLVLVWRRRSNWPAEVLDGGSWREARTGRRRRGHFAIHQARRAIARAEVAA